MKAFTPLALLVALSVILATRTESATDTLPTTSDPPSTTTDPPSTTTDPPTTTSDPPVTTTDPPSITTDPPSTTTGPPSTTSDPPATTSDPPVTTTDPPSTTTDPPSTTTGPPSTTSDPPATTSDPPSTTTDPPSTTTGPPSTTSDPPATTSDPPVTTSDPPSTTNDLPGTTRDPSSQTSITSPGPTNFCKVSPCGDEAVCVNLYSSRVCLCAEGYYYNSTSCLKGKTFPGEITVQVSDTSDLSVETSPAYQNLHEKVIDFFQQVFGNSDYGQTIILKVSMAPLLARSEMRADETPVYVSVLNILVQNTHLSESTITTMINDAIKSSSTVTGYFGQNLCDLRGCVQNDDNCNNGLTCVCKSGLQRPSQLANICLVSQCPDNCSLEDNKQCLKTDSGEPKCVCLSDYKDDGHGNCRKCPFGYSGMNCQDPFKLILTIVGSVAGFIILSLVILLICSVRSKNKKKNIEEQKLIDNDFQNLRLQQTGFSNLGAEGSIFPKVRTSASNNQTRNPYGQTQNPYANHRSVPRPDY